MPPYNISTFIKPEAMPTNNMREKGRLDTECKMGATRFSAGRSG